jgi:hypothetical protein
MFWHDDVRPKMYVMFHTHSLNRIEHPFTCALAGEERLPVEAGERQSMGVAGLVDPATGLVLDGA